MAVLWYGCPLVTMLHGDTVLSQCAGWERQSAAAVGFMLLNAAIGTKNDASGRTTEQNCQVGGKSTGDVWCGKCMHAR